MRLFSYRFVDIIHIDGWGIVNPWPVSLVTRSGAQDRVTYLDWIDPLFEEANSPAMEGFLFGDEVFYLRATACGSADELA